MLRDCPLCPLSGEFLSQIGAEFCQKLFCIYWNDHMAFILQFVEMVYCIDLQILKNPCVPRLNPTWSWCMIFLYCIVGYELLALGWPFLLLYSSVIFVCNFFVCDIFWIIEISVGSSKKQESSRKTSALLTASKSLTVWITTNCGKFFKRGE